jgi:ferredoxin
VSHTITLHGRGVRFVATEDRTVLESAEDAGVHLPAGCRTGACLNCAARLHEGRISMPPGTALQPEHLEQRVFLPCCAVPRSDCVIEVGRALGVLDVAPWTD